MTGIPSRTASTESSPARIHLDANPSRRRTVDGAWWPRSRDVVAEVTQLVRQAGELLGQIDRVGLYRAEWPDHPRRIRVDGRIVALGFFGSGEHLISLVRRLGDDIILLVVPPGLSEIDAAAVISRAVDSADRSRPAELLTGRQSEGLLAATA